MKGLSIEIARCTDFESAIESTSEFTALTQALDEVNKVMEAYSEENIMGKIMSMDGEGCGLDADLLDGKHGSEYATAKQGAKADSAIQGVKLNGTLLEPDDQNIVDIMVSESGISTVTYEAEISTNWETAETGEHVQSVEVAGILATDNPIVDVVLDALKDTALSQLEAWSCVSKIETADGSITVTCLEEAPTVAIPIQLKVVR